MTAPTRSSSSAQPEARCPVCGQGFVQYKSWLVRCAACGFLASTLVPGAGTGIEGLDTLRRANFENVLDRLEQHRKLAGLRLLEVGCATGLFLEAAARRGADVQGIEPELKNALFSRKKGLRVQSGFFPQDLDDRGRYDIIAFNDVFEHLPNPVESLKAVEQFLRPFGVAILNLPTSEGVLYRTATLLDRVGYGAPLERLWQKGLPSPHVSYFNERNLTLLALNHTTLTTLDRMRLSSVNRTGLYKRVKWDNHGPTAELLFVGAWLFSFVADRMPADIMALFFVRPNS